MNEFSKNLTLALGGDIEMAGPSIEKRIQEAARACLDTDHQTSLRFHREVTPEQKPRLIYTIIEHDSGELILPPEDVAILRALLTTWDEDELQPGTQYIIMVELPSGELVSEWLPAHDNG